MDLVLADQVADGSIGNEHLAGEDATLATSARQQRLTDDALEHEGKLGSHLGLLVLGEDVDDPVDGLRRRVGVQGGKGQVAGLGDLQRRLDGLKVAHLADQHHVRVLAQHRAEGVGVGKGVGVELALVDHRRLVRVQVLDGVLDGDDVKGLLGVDLVDHGGEGGRLAAAGWTGDQDQSAGFVAQRLDDVGQAELAGTRGSRRGSAGRRRRWRRAGRTRWRGNGRVP